MKNLLIGLMALSSLSVFADTGVMFIGRAQENTTLFGTNGCSKAKRFAKNDAIIKCMDAGFRKCKKLKVIREYSSRATFNDFGRCEMKAYYEGVE